MGVHRATVLSDGDPEGQGRLQVTLDSSGSAQWASRVFPLSAFAEQDVPVGAEVWIMFEDDDLSRPVVLGLVTPPSRRETLARGLEAMGDAWDHGHAAGTADAEGGVTPNPYR